MSMAIKWPLPRPALSGGGTCSRPRHKSRAADGACLYPHLEFPKRMNPGDASRRRVPASSGGDTCSRPRYKIPADRRCVSVPSFGIPETHEPQRRIPPPGTGAVWWEHLLPPRAINPARLIDGFMSVFQLGAPETCELRRRIPPPGTGAVRWGYLLPPPP